jgi:hypothetical protein
MATTKSDAVLAAEGRRASGVAVGSGVRVGGAVGVGGAAVLHAASVSTAARARPWK